MCYAIPAKIVDIAENEASVDYGGVYKTINLSLIDEITIGDYVLIHAGFAIEKLGKDDAEYTLELIRNSIHEAEKDLNN